MLLYAAGLCATFGSGTLVGMLLTRPRQPESSTADQTEIDALRAQLEQQPFHHEIEQVLAETTVSLLAAEQERDAAQRARMEEIARVMEERYSFPPTAPSADLEQAIADAIAGRPVDPTVIKATPPPVQRR